MSNLKNNIILIFFLSLLFIIPTFSKEPLNIVDTYNFVTSIRINDDEDLNFLLDTTKKHSYIFKDKDFPGKENLNENDDEFTTSIEINSLYNKNFEFDVTNNFLKEDKENYDEIYGVIGLGTIHGKNYFMDQMKKRKLIKKKIVYFFAENLEIKFQYELSKTYGNLFTYCPLLKYKDSLNEKYHESWICEMTHIYIKENSDNDKNLKFNDTYEIRGKAIFNPNSPFITIPEIYMHYLKIKYSINSKNHCVTAQNDDNYFLKCVYENINKLPYFGILIEGYLYKIPAEYLFKQTGEKEYISLLRFDKNFNKEHLWMFGLPLFKSYEMNFDFDEKRVGFGPAKLEKTNFTTEWISWYSINEGLTPRMFKSKVIMIIGISCLAVILVLIMICGLCGYFEKYNKDSGKLIEESQKFEMQNVHN